MHGSFGIFGKFRPEWHGRRTRQVAFLGSRVAASSRLRRLPRFWFMIIVMEDGDGPAPWFPGDDSGMIALRLVTGGGAMRRLARNGEGGSGSAAG